MSELNINEQNEHHVGDEAELDRLESNLENGGDRNPESPAAKGSVVAWIITAAVVGLIAIIGVAWIVNKNSASGDKAAAEEHKEESGHSEDEKGKEVKLDPEMLASAGIVTEAVTQRPAIARWMVTGAVELNAETTDMSTALVGEHRKPSRRENGYLQAQHCANDVPEHCRTDSGRVRATVQLGDAERGKSALVIG